MNSRLFLRLCSLLWFATRVALPVEIAGDVVDDRGDTTIRVGTAWYACRPGAPPLAHSWSYECNPSAQRSLLRVDCAKCARECPGIFADDFCARCRRRCD